MINKSDNFHPNIPCTNPNYKNEDVINRDSWWWTRHEDVPKKWQVVCLYPIHPDGLIEKSENYTMPDLGKVNINSLSAEARQRAEFLIAHYGADNMISLAMREFAEQYGYKPYEQALFDTEKQYPTF